MSVGIIMIFTWPSSRGTVQFYIVVAAQFRPEVNFEGSVVGLVRLLCAGMLDLVVLSKPKKAML